MKIEMVKVYEYSELSDVAKEKVLDRERELQGYDTWWIDDLKYIFEYMLDEKGIKAYPTDELEISMSLSYCQGDGVGFFGKIDVEYLLAEYPLMKQDNFPETLKLIEAYRKVEPAYQITLENEMLIEINHMYSSDSLLGHVDLDMPDIGDMLEECDGFDEYVIGQEREDFEVYLKDWFDDIAGEFERIGYADMEARESEEIIVQQLECHDIRFLKNGYMIDWAIVTEDDLKHT